MYEMFKNTKGDGIFRAYGHGNFETLFNGEERIRDAKTFDSVMSSKNKNWKNVDNMKDPILIIYACLSGTENNGRLVPMGKQISQAHPKLTVFAFNGFVTYDASVSGIKNSNLKQNSGDGNGIIKVYYGGKAIAAYQYKEFLKHYPAFK